MADERHQGAEIQAASGIRAGGQVRSGCIGPGDPAEHHGIADRGTARGVAFAEHAAGRLAGGIEAGDRPPRRIEHPRFAIDAQARARPADDGGPDLRRIERRGGDRPQHLRRLEEIAVLAGLEIAIGALHRRREGGGGYIDHPGQRGEIVRAQQGAFGDELLQPIRRPVRRRAIGAGRGGQALRLVEEAVAFAARQRVHHRGEHRIFDRLVDETVAGGTDHRQPAGQVALEILGESGRQQQHAAIGLRQHPAGGTAQVETVAPAGRRPDIPVKVAMLRSIGIERREFVRRGAEATGGEHDRAGADRGAVHDDAGDLPVLDQ